MTTTAPQPPTKKAFPDQITFITNIRKALTQCKRIIACAATGFGKTFVFLTISDSAISKNSTVLIITESTKIHKGIRKERPDAALITDRTKYLYVQLGTIYIAMAQTLKNRQAIIDQFAALGNKLIVFNDEAHINTATDILEQLPDAYILGVTATPDYRFARHLPKLYQGIVVGPQPSELVELGRLSPYYHYEKKAADLSGLKKGSNGEYTEKSNEWTFDRATVYAGFEEDIRRIQFRKAVVFCASIAHANHVTDGLRAAGYSVANVHTGNPTGDYELAEFEMGDKTNICVTVGQITKGWDFPAVTDIFFLRAFGSLPNYLQACGRGSRKFDGKERFTIWDYGGNATRHGLWITDRDWATMWLPPSGKKKRDSFAPAKECPQCYLMNAASARVCSECGYVWPVTERELAEGVMVDALIEYNGLRGRMISTLSPTELTAYCRTTGKKNYCARIARTLDVTTPNYLAEYAHTLGYKAGWLHHQAGQPTGFSDFFIR